LADGAKFIAKACYFRAEFLRSLFYCKGTAQIYQTAVCEYLEFRDKATGLDVFQVMSRVLG